MKIKKYKYKLVTSTNDIAIKLIKNKNINAGFVLANKQKKGRGQRGRKWISYKGNLFVSIFYRIEKMNLSLTKLTIINAKLIIKMISNYYKKNIKIKMPNDILINKKKICGILQETIQKNKKRYLIVGIGLNLIKSPKIKDYPTTNLYELTKRKISVNRISKELIFIYEKFLKTKNI
tara:strand:- start:52 stop:582 length:531 start_codon:yes stop_codon:yes gene_type:complete